MSCTIAKHSDGRRDWSQECNSHWSVGVESIGYIESILSSSSLPFLHPHPIPSILIHSLLIPSARTQSKEMTLSLTLPKIFAPQPHPRRRDDYSRCHRRPLWWSNRRSQPRGNLHAHQSKALVDLPSQTQCSSYQAQASGAVSTSWWQFRVWFLPRPFVQFLHHSLVVPSAAHQEQAVTHQPCTCYLIPKLFMQHARLRHIEIPRCWSSCNQR